MNNDAFQKMVRDRAKVKSTKEIAREAVEADFKRKHKKRKRGGGGGEEGDSSDSDDDQRKQNAKKQDRGDGQSSSALLFRPQHVKTQPDEEEDEASKYRDRAKERREGKVADDAVDEAKEDDMVLPPQKQGLDISLARKTKEKLQQRGSGRHADSKSIKPQTLTLPTKEEAKQALIDFLEEASETHPSIPSGISDYLVRLAKSKLSQAMDNVSCGVAGKTLQRTQLAMAMDGHPYDAKRAWEIPREKVRSDSSRLEQDYPSLPRLRNELLVLVEERFQKPTKRHGEVAPKPSLPPPRPKTDDTNENIQSEVKQDKVAVEATKPVEVDEDDDDIFAGLDDYTPPKPEKP